MINLYMLNLIVMFRFSILDRKYPLRASYDQKIKFVC